MRKAISRIALLTVLCFITACSITGHSNAPVADTKATANITRHICPPVPPLDDETAAGLDKALTACEAPRPSPLKKFICDKYKFVLSHWLIARDQSRVCYKQK